MKKRSSSGCCSGKVILIGFFLLITFICVTTGGTGVFSKSSPGPRNDVESLSNPPVQQQSDNQSEQQQSNNQSDNTQNDSSANNPAPVNIQPVTFERTAYYPINNCAHSRLHVGDSAVVSYGGRPNAIRSTADTHPANNIIYRAPSGEGLQIIGGPVCNYGWILWKVRTDTGYTGWTPESSGNEFWLTPIEAGSSIVANLQNDPKAYALYQKVNSTLQDPYLSESQKEQQIHVYQQTYGQELVATVIRYVPVYQDNGTFTSFDNWARSLAQQNSNSSDNSPINTDPVGSAMSIYFNPSSSNIIQQLGLGK